MKNLHFASKKCHHYYYLLELLYSHGRWTFFFVTVFYSYLSSSIKAAAAEFSFFMSQPKTDTHTIQLQQHHHLIDVEFHCRKWREREKKRKLWWTIKFIFKFFSSFLFNDVDDAFKLQVDRQFSFSTSTFVFSDFKHHHPKHRERERRNIKCKWILYSRYLHYNSLLKSFHVL